ncbi:UDP-3-O-[3-hydroxymyristoyl] glucosamine N-acyltransferase [Filimonas zeae]|uniref:UDP-3-O-acylglucosamine N-acyltransferase n=1 Tax=Filimonas zeae TaxID=1737353 RepID=A0A917J417_9BACT|nr:UDP-3-O-(3-hydroxymyristoyl)glucosamine N-acyltransferase [Filimonas zeae]MDR6341198.1 UDP-3-O-[3-hydroxymyristoyl] glucosamine N-acyltransferase [Filimonas zeae]GGH76832.1 UDP-3-O-acylglucosamine N-acyltransferase [Filimonas zeae]
MQFSAAQIAMLIDGHVEGNGDATVNSFGKIEEAKAGQLAFLANPKYEDFLYTTSASIIIINETQELKQPVQATLVKVKDAYTAFATLLHKYQEFMTQQLAGIQQPSYIAPSAEVGENVFIAAFAYVGDNVKVGNNVKIFPHVYLGSNVTVGDGTILHPGVKIYQECKVGKNVIIHAGSIIGSDGFGFAPQADGTYKKVPQIGNVIIEDNVEIGSNATIDRATIGSTLIKNGAKLDNLIQIAHNVEIGSNTVIAAQAGVSGSTKIGNNVMIGGQAGIVGHLQIADNSKINAQSGVTKSIKTNSSRSVTGTPAHDYTSALRSQALSRNLPDMEKRIAELEKMIQQLVDERENA